MDATIKKISFPKIDDIRVLMNIVGAIGWASFIEVRGEYNSLMNMIEGKVKDDTQG